MSEELWVIDSGKRKAVELVCQNCDKHYLHRKDRKDRSHYCSRQCAGEARLKQVIVECFNCGQEIKRPISKITGSASFCSRKCKDESQSLGGNGASFRPEHYGTSLKRTPCVICGSLTKNKFCSKGCRDQKIGPIDKESLSLLIEDGLSLSQIAKFFDISPGAIRHWLNKFGLKTSIAEKRGTGNCENCDKSLTGHQVKFCSHRCKTAQSSSSGARYKQQKQTRRTRKSLFIKTMGYKCLVCGYNKNSAAFTFHHKRPDGKIAGISKMVNREINTCIIEVQKCDLVCENCHRKIHNSEPVSASYKIQKEKINKKREQLLNILGGKCSKCGYNTHSFCLDFHHISDKKYNLSVREMASAIPMEELIAEVHKCIIFCANCHREEHNPECAIAPPRVSC